jgi:hypothetical protein
VHTESPRSGRRTALSLLHVNPIKLLILVAVINGVAAPPFLIVVMRVSSSRRLMGDYVNGNATILGWLTAAIMAAAAIVLFATGGISICRPASRAQPERVQTGHAEMAAFMACGPAIYIV